MDKKMRKMCKIAGKDRGIQFVNDIEDEKLKRAIKNANTSFSPREILPGEVPPDVVGNVAYEISLSKFGKPPSDWTEYVHHLEDVPEEELNLDEMRECDDLFDEGFIETVEEVLEDNLELFFEDWKKYGNRQD